METLLDQEHFGFLMDLFAWMMSLSWAILPIKELESIFIRPTTCQKLHICLQQIQDLSNKTLPLGVEGCIVMVASLKSVPVSLPTLTVVLEGVHFTPAIVTICW